MLYTVSKWINTSFSGCGRGQSWIFNAFISVFMKGLEKAAKPLYLG